MSNASEAYASARKQALACLSQRRAAHEDPYLPVLDHLLENRRIIRKESRGTIEIRTKRIIGTCHESRTQAFAANFMPLLEENTEFAHKWISLYDSCLEEGLRDSISVYELYGHYFVEEGNKRVSVMRALDNPLISARVLSITLDPASINDEGQYEAYLHFRLVSGISDIVMSRAKNYRKLEKVLNIDEEHHMEAQQRASLLSLFNAFESLYEKQHAKDTSRNELPPAGDAFLLFLEVFGWNPDEIYTQSELAKEIELLKPSFENDPDALKSALLTHPQFSTRKPVFSFLIDPVRASLIVPGDPQSSPWSRAHVEAFEEMANALKGKVAIQILNNASTPEKIDEALDEAVQWKADVIFTADPLMLQATNLYAAKYPKIRFLNCSLNPEATVVRSYYTRGYELQFLQGMAAGALTRSGKIGYIADYPIFGAIADINAFALGAMTVRPDVRVDLEWSTTRTPTNRDFPVDIDLIYIAGQDFTTRTRRGGQSGLFDVRTGKFAIISDTSQKWDVFYTRIIQSILNRTFRTDEISCNTPSINYWLGLSNGLMDITFTDRLPAPTRRLISQIKDDISASRFFVFEDAAQLKCRQSNEETSPASSTQKLLHDAAKIPSYEKSPASKDPKRDLSKTEIPDGESLSMEEIARMDWFVYSINGYLPDEDDLIPSAEQLVKLHGLDLPQSPKSDANEQKSGERR